MAQESITMSIQSLVSLFRQNGDERQAQQMDAYLKHHFIHLGIKAPLHREYMLLLMKKKKPNAEDPPLIEQ